MKAFRLALTGLLFCVAACGTLPASIPTPLPTATLDAYQRMLANVQAKATIDAIQAIDTANTATAYAPTQQAIATATERAWVMAGWTATVSVEQTATAVSSTATQQSWQATTTQRVLDVTATADMAAASAKATALYGEAVSVELAIERERMMNSVQAVAPWIVLAAVVVIGLVIAFRWSNVRPVQRDARGDAPLLVIDGKVYDADRNPYPLADFSNKKPQIPALTPLELQMSTTARDQMIDLATRNSQNQPQRRAIAQKMAPQNILPSQTSPIRVLPPEQARPLLGDVIPGIVQDAIETDLSDKGEVYE